MSDVDEIAVSLHCKQYLKSRPGQIHDVRTNEWLKADEIDTMIRIYEDRVQGWFLDYGAKLTKDHNAGFVVLQIAVAYIEGNQQFREGKTSQKEGKKMFIRGMRRIFGAAYSEKDLGQFYDGVRCGLFHDGFTKRKVWIANDYPDAVRFESGRVLVSPNRFFKAIQADLRNYVEELRDPQNVSLRDKFKDRYLNAP